MESFPFLDLPQELQIQILQHCLPKDLARNLGNRKLNEVSRDNQIWNQWLIKPVQGDAKAQFANHLDNVKEEARPLHPLGLVYNTLLAIIESSTLSADQKSDQLTEKALENTKAFHVLLLYSIFWEPLLSTYTGIDNLIFITQSSSAAALTFFKNREFLASLVLTEGTEAIAPMILLAVRHSPATAPFSLQQKQLVDIVLEHPDGKKFIKEIEALAAQEIEGSTSEISHRISRLQYYKNIRFS